MNVYPFCGIIYNPERFPNLTDVIAPPYDVISEAEKRFLQERSPYNIVRLILGEQRRGDYFEESFYQTAAQLFHQWQAEGILTRLTEPAIFYLHQFFTGPDGHKHLRRGFISLVNIADYGPDTVRAHEHTLKGPVLDRLKLVATTRANFSQVFFTFEDPQNQITQILDEGIAKAVLKLEGRDETAGVDNVCYVIQESEVLDAVQEFMAPKPLFIADGHHRYETLRQYMFQRQRETGLQESDANYVMGYFASSSDPGLVIYPTHRTLKAFPEFSTRQLMDRLYHSFEVTRITADEISLKRDSQVFYMADSDGTIYRLEVKPAALRELELTLPDPRLARLDTVVLDRFILQDILGFSENDRERALRLSYHHDLESFWQAMQAGHVVGWILNYPDPHLIYEIAGGGSRLPPKSTYFYPKLPTGFVLRALED